jgi:hypothetical protein
MILGETAVEKPVLQLNRVIAAPRDKLEKYLLH